MPPPTIALRPEVPAMAALTRLAGLASSPVLTARLRRAAHLLPGCDPARAHIDDTGWAALLDAVTVQETRLFRHPAQCAAVAALLPERLAAARTEGRALRLLSAGCATGEEAFSLGAMALAAAEEVPINVLGLDLCRPALASAEAGLIGQGLGDPLGLVPAELRPWLVAADGAARLHPALRRSLRFQRANLLDGVDAGGGFDVVFCRNVLIYLTEPARAAVLASLVRALRPGGLLALGPTDRAPAGLPRIGDNIWRRQP